MENHMHKNRAPIVKQCPKRWGEMKGGEKVRLCESCDKEVHNLSDMTHREATEFMAALPEGTCLIYGHDAHGEIIHPPELAVPWLPKIIKNSLRSMFVAAALLPAEIACGAESSDIREYPYTWDEQCAYKREGREPTEVELRRCPEFVDMLEQDMSKRDMSDMFIQDMAHMDMDESDMMDQDLTSSDSDMATPDLLDDAGASAD